jgi:hypothetical protein
MASPPVWYEVDRKPVSVKTAKKKVLGSSWEDIHRHVE